MKLALMIVVGFALFVWASWEFVGKSWANESPSYDPSKPNYQPPEKAPHYRPTESVTVHGKGGNTFVAVGDPKSIAAVKKDMTEAGHKVK